MNIDIEIKTGNIVRKAGAHFTNWGDADYYVQNDTGLDWYLRFYEDGVRLTDWMDGLNDAPKFTAEKWRDEYEREKERKYS